MDIILFLLYVLGLLVSSAVLTCSEAAILSVSYTKAKEILSTQKSKKKKRNAEKLIFIKDNIKEYITTLVILTNIVNIVGSIYVGVLASELFGEFYIGIVSGVLTFLIIVFSEIIPKVYGERNSEAISLFIAGPLMVLTKILKPFVYMLNKIAGLFIKGKDDSNYVSEGEIREMAALGEKEGSINSYESEVIQNVFRMNDIEVYDVMIPKHKVEIIEYSAKYETVVEICEKTGCTRFPVVKEEEVVGLINIKDLLKYYGKEKNFKVSKILRPIIFAPESMKLFSLQEKLKKNRVHMAAIVNEHGDFTGIVTFEDIIEELLGDINDEYDSTSENSENIKEINPKKYHILGETEISEFNEYFKFDVNGDETDYTTLNGFLTTKLDKIPKVNDELKLEQGTFRIIKANKQKVLMIEFNIK